MVRSWCEGGLVLQVHPGIGPEGGVGPEVGGA